MTRKNGRRAGKSASQACHTNVSIEIAHEHVDRFPAKETSQRPCERRIEVPTKRKRQHVETRLGSGGKVLRFGSAADPHAVATVTEACAGCNHPLFAAPELICLL
jgi:hypothetical protein